MADLHFLLPGDLETKTGGYLYDKHIIAGLRALGWMVILHRLGEGFPLPNSQELAEAQTTLASIPSDSLTIVDGLALGGMPVLIKSESERLRLIGLIHHPLAAETGLSVEHKALLYDQERVALAAVERVIVTSTTTSQMLQADYAVDPAKLGVVMPGTDLAPLAKGSRSACRNLLCVASFTPRKGHSVLLDALAGLQDRRWRLICIGSLDRDPATVRAVDRHVEALGLRDRVELIGELQPAALANYYDQADVFVLPSYLEGYGMVLAEALARGLPIISTTGGAIPQTVPAAAGLLVPPGDSRALQEALVRILDDTDLYLRLTEGARAARMALPTWDQAVKRFARELTGISKLQ